MSHVSIIFFFTNLACLVSGIALGVALEMWRCRRNGR